MAAFYRAFPEPQYPACPAGDEVAKIGKHLEEPHLGVCGLQQVPFSNYSFGSWCPPPSHPLLGNAGQGTESLGVGGLPSTHPTTKLREQFPCLLLSVPFVV